jgi:hypothetical protein
MLASILRLFEYWDRPMTITGTRYQQDSHDSSVASGEDSGTRKRSVTLGDVRFGDSRSFAKRPFYTHLTLQDYMSSRME